MNARCIALSIAIAAQALAGFPALAADPPVRAQLQAKRFAQLSAAIAGQIQRLDVREGDRVAEGAPLVTIECSLQRASRQVAAAKSESAQAKLTVNQQLVKNNAASILEVQVAQAEMQMAQAEMAAADAVLRKCDIRAPFAGVVASKSAQAYQYVREGDPLLELVDATNLEVELVVPAAWLVWLKPGLSFSITLDGVGADRAAVVDRLGGRVDPVSQTVRMLGRIEGGSAGLLPGMSGIVHFKQVGAAN